MRENLGPKIADDYRSKSPVRKLAIPAAQIPLKAMHFALPSFFPSGA